MPAIATGTAVVLAPGGAMRVLGIDSNGTQVAQLAERERHLRPSC